MAPAGRRASRGPARGTVDILVGFLKRRGWRVFVRLFRYSRTMRSAKGV